MTRRSFISDMLKCGVATTFLPGAGRIWKPTHGDIEIRFVRPQLIGPFWGDYSQLLYELTQARLRAGIQNSLDEKINSHLRFITNHGLRELIGTTF